MQEPLRTPLTDVVENKHPGLQRPAVSSASRCAVFPATDGAGDVVRYEDGNIRPAVVHTLVG